MSAGPGLYVKINVIMYAAICLRLTSTSAVFTMSVSCRWFSSLLLLWPKIPSLLGGTLYCPCVTSLTDHVYFLRLYVDLSMEATLFGGPYQWAVFAGMETLQLLGCIAVHPLFIVSS